MSKSSIKVDIPIRCDLNSWLNNYPHLEDDDSKQYRKWQSTLKELDNKFGLANEQILTQVGKIDSYEAIRLLSELIAPNATLVTDMGTSFTCTMQAFKNERTTRLFTSSGTSSMGFGLPGAIGAYFADRNRPIYLIAGDGGFQMNIQELQTIKYHNIPIRMLILNSNGYLAISIMQQNSFDGNLVGCNPESGIDSPEFVRIANAYGIDAIGVNSSQQLETVLRENVDVAKPILLEIGLPEKQVMRPRSQSLRNEDGSFYSKGIEVMWPYLPEVDVFQIENLINSPHV
jgi:acetolactate synthase-1/2/3 large subunit